MKDSAAKSVTAWLAIAAADLRACTLLHNDPEATPASLGLACYHAQQCAEKAIKAVLVGGNVPFPFTHDLVELLELGQAAGIAFDAIQADCVLASAYGVWPRYPSSVPPADLQGAIDATAAAARIVAWSEGKLRLKFSLQ